MSPPLWSQSCTGGPSVTPVLILGNPGVCTGFYGGFRIEPVASGTYSGQRIMKKLVITE